VPDETPNKFGEVETPSETSNKFGEVEVPDEVPNKFGEVEVPDEQIETQNDGDQTAIEGERENDQIETGDQKDTELEKTREVACRVGGESHTTKEGLVVDRSTVMKGDGVSQIIKRQLEGGTGRVGGEAFKFSGNQELMNKAYEIAKTKGFIGEPGTPGFYKFIVENTGYINAEGTQEIRITADAIGKTRYVLEINETNDSFVVREVRLGDAPDEVHDFGADFEGENHEQDETVVGVKKSAGGSSKLDAVRQSIKNFKLDINLDEIPDIDPDTIPDVVGLSTIEMPTEAAWQTKLHELTNEIVETAKDKYPNKDPEWINEKLRDMQYDLQGKPPRYFDVTTGQRLDQSELPAFLQNDPKAILYMPEEQISIQDMDGNRYRIAVKHEGKDYEFVIKHNFDAQDNVTKEAFKFMRGKADAIMGERINPEWNISRQTVAAYWKDMQNYPMPQSFVTESFSDMGLVGETPENRLTKFTESLNSWYATRKLNITISEEGAKILLNLKQAYDDQMYEMGMGSREYATFGEFLESVKTMRVRQEMLYRLDKDNALIKSYLDTN